MVIVNLTNEGFLKLLKYSILSKIKCLSFRSLNCTKAKLNLLVVSGSILLILFVMDTLRRA